MIFLLITIQNKTNNLRRGFAYTYEPEAHVRKNKFYHRYNKWIRLIISKKKVYKRKSKFQKIQVWHTKYKENSDIIVFSKLDLSYVANAVIQWFSTSPCFNSVYRVQSLCRCRSWHTWLVPVGKSMKSYGWQCWAVWKIRVQVVNRCFRLIFSIINFREHQTLS